MEATGYGLVYMVEEYLKSCKSSQHSLSVNPSDFEAFP
jgi:hypothetical protein